MASGRSPWVVVGLVLGALLLVVLFVGGYVRTTYNELVSQQVGTQTAWSQVENQLQRRNDLIPNLVETVKGYAKQETTIFTEIANARARIGSGQPPQSQMQASNDLSNAISRLLVIVENYPQLKSGENFMRLQDELAGTENRLAVERMRYNETVQAYNTHIRQFPSNLVASAFNFEAKPLFEAPASAKVAPNVKF
ncbi:MAG TPA: LemA family protein [Candidatus Angelobacter sp.]|nr:LemA family protein [Candidatus Angelobacter sp.]